MSACKKKDKKNNHIEDDQQTVLIEAYEWTLTDEGWRNPIIKLTLLFFQSHRQNIKKGHPRGWPFYYS